MLGSKKKKKTDFGDFKAFQGIATKIIKLFSVDWKEPEKLFATRTIRERRIPSFTGRSHLESQFIHEIDNGEEKDKLNYCWQMYAKMLCLCFGLVFLNLIFLATVVPIGFIYVNEELKPGERLAKTFECPWTALCPGLDCQGKIILN